MSRRGILGAGLLLALVLAGALTLLAAGTGLGGGGSAVPTTLLRREPFRLTIRAEGVLTAVQAQAVLVPSGLFGGGRIAWLAPDGSRVAAGDVVVRFDPSELEKERDAAEANLERNDHERESHRAESAASLGNLDRDAEMARQEEDLARRFETRDAEIYSRVQVAESQIDGRLAAERRRHAEAAREGEEKLSRVEGQLLALSRRSFELELDQAREGLASLEVKAPFDGILVLSRDWRGNPVKVGDNVWPGMEVAEIPDLSALQAEVYVLEADAGALAEGKPARMVVEAHPERSYEATLRTVGKLAQQRLRSSPVQYFTVTLELADPDREQLFPGQRVEAELFLADLADALVVPRQAIFERDGRTVVYRRRDGAFTAVPVRLGLTGPGRAVIEEGLEAGDEVALADPEAGRGGDGGPGEGLPEAFQAGGRVGAPP